MSFDQNTAFPVTADPNDFWGWTKCVAAIGAFIAGNMFLVSKVAKIGGVAKVAVKLFEAKNATERWGALATIFGEVSGVSAIIDNCQ